MARKFLKRDISPVLSAAELWIGTCLIEDRSMFSTEPRWTSSLLTEVFKAFVEHPDYGDDNSLERGPLSRRSTFLSYESVEAMNCLEHLAHTNDGIITEYEEPAE